DERRDPLRRVEVRPHPRAPMHVEDVRQVPQAHARVPALARVEVDGDALGAVRATALRLVRRVVGRGVPVVETGVRLLTSRLVAAVVVRLRHAATSLPTLVRGPTVRPPTRRRAPVWRWPRVRGASVLGLERRGATQAAAAGAGSAGPTLTKWYRTGTLVALHKSAQAGPRPAWARVVGGAACAA